MTSFLLTLALIGFIGLRFYRFRTKVVHGISNGWNLIFSSLLWGATAYLPTYITLKLFFSSLTLSLVVEPSSLRDEIILLHYSLPVVFVFLIAFVVSTQWFLDLQQFLMEKLLSEKQLISPSGLIPSKLHDLLQERVLISLKTGKVYVGVLLEVDFHENILYENRALVLIPLKSGYRRFDKKVVYKTRYVDKKGILIPKPIVIKLSEVESFTKFSSSVDKFFKE